MHEGLGLTVACRWMKRPRCGVADKIGAQVKANMRRKRYALTGRRWSQAHLSFRYVPQLLRHEAGLFGEGTFGGGQERAVELTEA